MKYQGKDLASFPEQIQYALDNFNSAALKSIKDKNISQVVICGVGGSGIAGRIVRNYLLNKSSLQVTIVAGYDLPTWVSSKTLIICSSYSGNTEETLSCFSQAQALNSPIIALTGGGELMKLAEAQNLPVFKAKKGLQPRMALGYSFTYLLCIFETLTGIGLSKELKNTLPELQQPLTHQNNALQVIDNLHLVNTKWLQIVADGPNTGMAIRLQQQLNENTKIWAQVHEIPEMCHNVIEAATRDNIRSPWLLINSGTHDRNNMRFEYLSNLLKRQGYPCLQLKIDGSSFDELIHGILTFDWLSLLIADRHGKDSSQIPNILGLKEHLSK